MAKGCDDGEFRLPPWFLTDDDILMDFKANKLNSKSRVADSGVYFPSEFPCGFGSFGPYSDLSSPGESVVSSTETESDEEDYIAGLTRKMVHSTLHDDLWKADSGFGYESQKCWPMAGSPQSTLCSVIGGTGSKQGSSWGSPNCPSQVSSPSTAAAVSRNDADWDLLYAAAGEVARMRMRMIEESTGYFQNRGLLAPPRKPSPVSVPLENRNPNPGFRSNQSLSYQQLQVAQFQQLKQQQMMKQQGSAVWGQLKAGGHNPRSQTHEIVQNTPRNSDRPLGLPPSAWPTLQQSQQQQQQQQQPSSGMRAVFLGNSGSKRECAGTGVFLPRRIGSPTEIRKKPGCSTVLVPDRVIQALNLNLDAMDAQPHLQSQTSRYKGSFTSEYDAALKYRNNVFMGQQKQSVRSQSVMNQELRLPPEWTY